MATSYTKTISQTYTRMGLLKMQIRVALKLTTSISDETLNRLMVGVENKWINKFHVYALDAKGLCRGQFTLEIDWDEHSLQIARGNATIAIDEQKWVNGAAVEVIEAANLFNEFVTAYSLRTDWQTLHPPSITANENTFGHVLEQLGLRLADPIKWAPGPEAQTTLKNRILSELRVGLRLLDD